MQNLKLYLSAIALVSLAGLPLTAQQPATDPSAAPPSQSTPAQPTTSAQQSAVPAPSTANSPEATNTELRPVQCELEKKLDSKSAKAGDAVVVKTTENATTAGGVVIPKGTKIVGQVVDAQAAGNGSQNSKITVLFDHAELKDGQNLPIKSLLQSVAPPEDTSAASSAQPAGASPTGASGLSTGGAGSSATASTTGGSSAATRSTVPTGGSAATPSTEANVSAGATAPMTPSAGSQAGSSAPAAGTVIARQGSVAITTTAIPGVLIATNAEGRPFSNASGAILGAHQNVHLDGGTHVVLAVTDAATKGTNTR